MGFRLGSEPLAYAPVAAVCYARHHETLHGLPSFLLRDLFTKWPNRATRKRATKESKSIIPPYDYIIARYNYLVKVLYFAVAPVFVEFFQFCADDGSTGFGAVSA